MLRRRRVVVLNSWIGWDEAMVPHPIRSERVRAAWKWLGSHARFVGVSPASAEGARAVFEHTTYIPHAVDLPADLATSRGAVLLCRECPVSFRGAPLT